MKGCLLGQALSQYTKNALTNRVNDDRYRPNNRPIPIIGASLISTLVIKIEI